MFDKQPSEYRGSNFNKSKRNHIKRTSALSMTNVVWECKLNECAPYTIYGASREIHTVTKIPSLLFVITCIVIVSNNDSFVLHRKVIVLLHVLIDNQRDFYEKANSTMFNEHRNICSVPSSQRYTGIKVTPRVLWEVQCLFLQCKNFVCTPLTLLKGSGGSCC